MVRVVVRQQKGGYPLRASPPPDWRPFYATLRTDLIGLGRPDMSFDAQVRQLDALAQLLQDRDQAIDEKMRSIEDKAMKAIDVNRQVKSHLDDAIYGLEQLKGWCQDNTVEPQNIKNVLVNVRAAQRLL